MMEVIKNLDEYVELSDLYSLVTFKSLSQSILRGSKKKQELEGLLDTELILSYPLLNDLSLGFFDNLLYNEVYDRVLLKGDNFCVSAKSISNKIIKFKGILYTIKKDSDYVILIPV